MVKVKEDMTGWIMSEHGVPDSRLTVIRQVEDHIYPSGAHRDQWLCECSCEKHTIIQVLGNKLRNGYTKSCGCLQREIVATRSKKYNNYEKRQDDNGEYYVGWTTNTNKEFYFDLEDYDRVKDIAWNETAIKGFHAIQGYIPERKTVVRMHVFLGYNGYDHIDRNELNNRKNNLRVCTHQENMRNSSLGKNNTSGVIGVTWDKKRNKWQAQIGLDKKCKYLGLHINKEDAIKARLKAEVEYFGDFAPQKHLFEKYGITVQND